MENVSALLTNGKRYIIISPVKFLDFTLNTIFRCEERRRGDIVAKDLKFSLLLDIYGGMLTDKQREMLDFYYNEDLSLSEIAANAGISRQGVRDSIKRGEQALIELDDKIGLSKIIEGYNLLLSRIQSACDEIINDCKTYTTSKSVIGKLEKIKNEIEERDRNGV